LDIFGLLAFVNTEHTIADEDFSSSTGWLLGTGVSITEGVLRANTSGSSILAYKPFVDTGAQQVRVTFTISNYVSGTVRYRNFSGGATGTRRSANGTYTETLSIIDSGNANHGFEFESSFVGDIDDFEIVQLTADGAVTTWYDQTGNGNDATNSTASEQGLIVEAGDIIYEGATISRPAVDFDGVDDHFDISNFTSVPTISQFNVLKPSATNVDETFTSIQNATTTDGIFLGQGNLGTEAKFGLRNFQGADIADSGIAMTLQQYLLAGITTSTTAQIYANGVAGAISAKARGNVNGDTQIGANGASGNNFSGKFQEIIIFESDQSANRTGIEGNIDNYFRITS